MGNICAIKASRVVVDADSSSAIVAVHVARVLLRIGALKAAAGTSLFLCGILVVQVSTSMPSTL